MSALSGGGIGPVSVRYAAQIRDLLYAQAIRAEAREAARAQEAKKPEPKEEAEPVKVDIKVDVKPAEPSKDEPRPEPVRAEPVEAKAQLVDIQV